MIAAAWDRVPVRWRVDAVTFLLVGAAFASGWAGGLMSHAPTLTRTVQVVHAPGTGAALVAAWGKPDQAVDGSQINAGLKGTTCAVYQSRRAIVCYAP